MIQPVYGNHYQAQKKKLKILLPYLKKKISTIGSKPRAALLKKNLKKWMATHLIYCMSLPMVSFCTRLLLQAKMINMHTSAILFPCNRIRCFAADFCWQEQTLYGKEILL